MLKEKEFQNTIKTMGLYYKRRSLLKNYPVKKKITAAHLPLLLNRSITFHLSVHTNCFIAWCMEIPIPEYTLFKLTKGDRQEIFCCAWLEGSFLR